MRIPFFGKRKKNSAGRGNGEKKNAGSASPNGSSHSIKSELAANVRWIQRQLGNSSDIVVRTLSDPRTGAAHTAFLYIGTMVDEGTLNDSILKPLLKRFGEEDGLLPPAQRFYAARNNTLSVGQINEIFKLEDAIAQLLQGNTIILFEGCKALLSAGTMGGATRSVEEPSSQTVTRGPKESFTENFKTNLSLIRRRIKSPELRVEYRELGTKTKTHVAVVYLKGTAKDEIVKEIHERLGRIDTDAILESGYIEEFIQDAAITPFPTIQNTERPDAAAAAMLEGQIVLVVDGTPFSLIMPVTFTKFFQSSEDYYQRYDIATFLRLIRYVAFFVSMLLPSLYIAITTFHQEMLPTPLLISLAAQREGVPFPALFEALLMEITFEVLREAGVRMPRVIGPAISIVGALVLGQASVQAGLVSAAMVIVVSFTAIANFVIPAINMAIAARLIRFGMMLLGGSLGLFGIMSGLMVLLAHLASLRSFGVPYLTPFTPLVWSNWKDTFVRAPHWAMKKRPKMIAASSNLRRQSANNQMPEPPQGSSGRGDEEGGE